MEHVMTPGTEAHPAAPPWPQRAAARLRRVVERLPVQPPSFVLARVLDRVLLPRLPADALAALDQRTVEVVVSDLGLRVRLQLDADGFRVAPARSAVVLRIVAPAQSYLRLLRGQDDADRLFFERALVMEGDTEMGLVLKNTLDAIEPLWRPTGP
jgi:O2-independent ubiquinone biosynthesis accessory factor UbiT